ncbi:MAG: ATP-binding protein, partial [Natronomonas sp.]
MNPAASDLFDTTAESAIGTDLETLCQDVPKIRKFIGKRTRNVDVTIGEKPRYFSMRTEPINEKSRGTTIVLRDVTELKEYERQLQEQRDNLELLNQVVRHDIRNDMTVVRGRANLLEKYIEREDEAWDDLQAIQKSTDDAIELTKTARDLAETMLSTEADVEAVSLDQHLDSVIENARSTYDNVIIIVEEEEPDARVVGDELLEAVFRNLVQNAVVHNDKDTPEIHISTTLDEGTVTVVVADNGPGIPDEQKEEIFGKGEKGLDSSGAGSGLYLVRTVVEQYDGDVWIEDNDPEGSAFVVELPNADAEQD